MDDHRVPHTEQDSGLQMKSPAGNVIFFKRM